MTAKVLPQLFSMFPNFAPTWSWTKSSGHCPGQSTRKRSPFVVGVILGLSGHARVDFSRELKLFSLRSAQRRRAFGPRWSLRLGPRGYSGTSPTSTCSPSSCFSPSNGTVMHRLDSRPTVAGRATPRSSSLRCSCTVWPVRLHRNSSSLV